MASLVKRVRLRTSFWAAGAALLPLLLAPAIAAAQSEGQLDDDHREGAEANTIIVTAQKREQNVQEVPIAITAVPAAALEAGGITSTIDLSAVVPGLNVTQQLSTIAPVIRGVGNYNAAPGAEGAVATYVDGVYRPDAYSSVMSLANIDRIEVLRGPQGTLFGRNATGGLIHIVTRTPSHVSSGEFSVSYANKDTFEAKGYVTGGVGDSVAMDLSAFIREQGNGFGVNLANGKDATFRDEFALRSKLLIEPSDNFTLTIAGDYADSTSDLGVNRRPAEGTTSLLGTPAPENFWSVNRAVSDVSENEQWSVSGKAEFDLGSVGIMGLVSYGESKTDLSVDQGDSASPFIAVKIPIESETLTAELQFTSGTGGFIEWIAGLYYFDSTAGVYPFAFSGPGTPSLPTPGGPYSNINLNNVQQTRSYSAFGELVANLSETTRLTLGGRITRDERDFTGDTNFIRIDGTVIDAPTRNLAVRYTEPTWRIVLDQKIDPDVLVYASYSRGFKSGIFNVFSPAAESVDPEILDAYEIGFKSELGDLRLNGAAFYYEYDGLQLTTQVAGSVLLRNAARAESKGLELEANWFVSDSLTFDANFSYVDAKFKDFPGAELTAPNPAYTGSFPPPPNVTTIGNAAGNRLPRAPEFTFSIGARYEQDVAFGRIGGSANLFYNDGFFNEFANRFKQDSYALLNASLFAEFGKSGQFRVTAFGRNLFNKEYYSYATATRFGDYIAPAFGREYGLRFSMKF